MECIFKLREQLEVIWEKTEDLSISGSQQNHFIAAMLFVALNHCDAIQLLSQKRNFASADALARPMLESAIRSIWLHRVATESQIQKCMDSDKFKSTWKLIEDIETTSEIPPMLSRFWNYLKPVMHSYTHGGVENAYRQLGIEGVITPNKPDNEIREYIQIVGALSLTVLAEIASLSGKVNIDKKLEDLSSKYLEWAFNKSLQQGAR